MENKEFVEVLMLLRDILRKSLCITCILRKIIYVRRFSFGVFFEASFFTSFMLRIMYYLLYFTKGLFFCVRKFSIGLFSEGSSFMSFSGTL